MLGEAGLTPGLDAAVTLMAIGDKARTEALSFKSEAWRCIGWRICLPRQAATGYPFHLHRRMVYLGGP
jgi:hypothetical protein